MNYLIKMMQQAAQMTWQALVGVGSFGEARHMVPRPIPVRSGRVMPRRESFDAER
jgi:hypothetical protein